MPVRQPWSADSGTVGEVSIGRLVMDGWVPGILMCTLLICGCSISV